MANPHNLKAGRVLWFHPSITGNERVGCYLTIKAVGRKWATTYGRGWRFDIETLEVDGAGYSSPGTCWVSKLLCERHYYRECLWELLCRQSSRNVPECLTTHKLQEFLGHCGVPVPMPPTDHN